MYFYVFVGFGGGFVVCFEFCHRKIYTGTSDLWFVKAPCEITSQYYFEVYTCTVVLKLKVFMVFSGIATHQKTTAATSTDHEREEAKERRSKRVSASCACNVPLHVYWSTSLKYSWFGQEEDGKRRGGSPAVKSPQMNHLHDVHAPRCTSQWPPSDCIVLLFLCAGQGRGKRKQSESEEESESEDSDSSDDRSKRKASSKKQKAPARRGDSALLLLVK